MRDKALGEFEAVFERASIPVLDIQPVRLARVAVALAGSSLDNAVLDVADSLVRRFKSQMSVHWRQSTGAGKPSVERAGMTVADQPYASTAELIGQVSIDRSELIIVPDPPDDDGQAIDMDDLVRGARPPVLLIRRPPASPDDPFRRILHSLTGNFQQSENFSHPFSLLAADGELMLLHVVARGDVSDVREALHLAPGVEDAETAAVLEELSHHGERYLKAVAAAGRQRHCDVRYRVEVGSVIEAVTKELQRSPYGLLVVGHHVDRHSHVDAEDYQLMHRVRDVAILAL